MSDSRQEQYRKTARELTSKIEQLIKGAKEQGVNFVVKDYEGIPIPIHLSPTCDGKDVIMAYECCLSPHHEGRCYSASKRVDFTPTNKTWEDHN